MHRRPPVGRIGPFQPGPERPPLALAWHVDACQVQERRHDVHVLGERLDHPTGATGFREPAHHGRVADDERNVERLVEEAQLGHEAVVAEHLPVVRGDDDDGVVSSTRPFQGCEQPTDLVVHLRHHPVVGGTQLAQVQRLRRRTGVSPGPGSGQKRMHIARLVG